MRKTIALLFGIIYLAVAAVCASQPAGTSEIAKKTKARSQQKAVATFMIDSRDCVIDGKPMVMEAPLLSKERHFIFVPARSFALAIGIPDGEYVEGKKTFPKEYLGNKDRQFDLVSMTRDNVTVTGAWIYLTIQGKSYYRETLVYIDSAGVPYISMYSFAKAFGYDMYVDEESGVVELFPGMPLGENDLVLAGLMPWKSSESLARDTFGSPDEVRSYLGGWRELIYADKRVRLEGTEKGENKVIIVTITNSAYETMRGVVVGDSIAKVIDRYGMGFYFNKKQNCYYYTFLTTHVDNERYIAFKVAGDRVTAIEVADHWIP